MDNDSIHLADSDMLERMVCIELLELRKCILFEGVPDPPPPSLAAGPTFTLPTSESFTQALNAHTLKTDMRNPAPEQSNRLLEEILQSKPHSGTPGAQCDMTNLVNMATNEISNQDEIEHFLCLEEVTANARQLFSSPDPTLLPKTPLGKKKSRLKKPHHSSIAGEIFYGNPWELSQLAHEKMKRVPMTTKKTRGTCQVIFKGDSFESSSSYKEVVKGADSGHGENCESHFEEMEYESTVDPCESAVNPLALDTPSKKNDGVKCLSVKVSLERLSHLHTSQEVDSSKDTTQVTVTNAYQEEGVGCISETTCSYSNLRLEDSDDNKSTRIKELDVQRSGNEMCKGKEKEEPLSPNNCTENACTKCENYDECNSQSRTPEESKQKNLLQPIPSGRTTRTKQKELQLSTRGDITDNMVSTADQPHPIPKPRLTRTKQKEVLPLLDTIDESEGQLLPPMDFPKPRMTRTKTKAKEQTNKFENVEYDSQSSVEEGYNTHEKAVAQPSEEIPMSRSTRTKKKVIEVISLTDTPVKNDINKSVDNESQKPRTTRTKKRMFDELGVDQPTRSTRTKCKKMEEQPEKESVASEKLGLCLFLTEPEDEKDGKSSQVVQKSPLVRSVPSVTSMKPSQSATSYTSENTVMAATSTQNTEIGPVTHSPAHVTRHARVRHAKTPDSQRVRIKPPARTPPATCTSDKVIRPKKILLSSSSSTHGSSRDTPKTFSRSRLMLTSSSSVKHKIQKVLHTVFIIYRNTLVNERATATLEI
ncbi:putative Inner centromere protein-like 2, partial [Homarus americanus]